MSGQHFTGVSGSWLATRPTGNGTSTSADATWIGIGGVGTQDLIQVGTENTVSSSGQVSSAVFYELLPDAPIYPAAILVKPGDSITASISEAATNQWTITITNVTTGKVFSTSVSYTSSYSTAEWIQEDPSYASGGLVPFDSFGTASFSGSSATYGGSSVNLTAGNAYAIKMVDSANNAVATPSVVSSSGTDFTVTRN